jgi:hypothetical protein
MKFNVGDRVRLLPHINPETFITSKTQKPPYCPEGLPQQKMVYFVEMVYHEGKTITLLGYPSYTDGDSGDFQNISPYAITCFENLTILKQLND